MGFIAVRLFLSTLRAFCSVGRFSFLITAAVATSALTWQDASAVDVDISWNANSETDIVSYRLYVGSQPNSFDQKINVGSSVHHTLSGLNAGQRYYFVATATNSAGLESDYSAALIVDLPPDGPDSDGDSIQDGADADDDNDGISDEQESASGSDPLDPASGPKPFIQQSCAHWDGSFGGLWNVVELRNAGPAAVHGALQLSNTAGSSLSKTSFSLGSLQEIDLQAHMYSGYQIGGTGNLCVTHDGETNDVMGAVVLYKPVSPANVPLGKKYDFAYPLALSAGRVGAQFVAYDTTQRSTAPSDAGDLVGNWIQVENVGTEPVTGRLVFYNTAGSILSQKNVQVGANRRVDTFVNQFGAYQRGLVEWIPALATDRVSVRNVSYLYDNAGTAASFSSAFAAEATESPGSLLVIPATTELSQSLLLEVSNVLNIPTNVTVNAYDMNGRSLMSTVRIALKPKATWQSLITKFKNKKAVIIVKADKPRAIVADARQFARTASGSILYMYSVTGKTPSGSLLEGVYDTHDFQQSVLYLTNSSTKSTKALVTIRRSNGQIPLAPFWITIPARAVRTYTVTDPDAKGIVTVQPGQPNTVVSWLMRRRNYDYVVPLQLQSE